MNRLIRATYGLRGLIQYFTAGEPEVRAWTIRKGSNAVKAAGEIHSDIEKGFIRAEVVRCADLLAAGSIAAAKEKAQVRLEGEEYILQGGDVILFRHSGGTRSQFLVFSSKFSEIPIGGAYLFLSGPAAAVR